jgi:pilus assembly protein Flp/PilA
VLEFVFRIAKCDRGATAVEYGLIVSLIIIAMIASLGNLAESNNGIWINVSNKFTKSTR